MALIVIFDDRRPTVDEVRGSLGVDRYGAIIHRKKTLRQRSTELFAQLRLDGWYVLEHDDDVVAVRRRLQAGHVAQPCLYVPSHVVITPGEASSTFISKLAYADDRFVVDGIGGDGEPRVLVAPAADVADLLMPNGGPDWKAFSREQAGNFRPLPNHAGWCDISQRSALMSFISTTFDVRNFNAIEQQELVVIKRSVDKEKMRREAGLYEQLDGPIRMFFLPPLSYADEGETASYTLERLRFPDVAIQWIHDAFDDRAFGAFLERIGRFLAMRQTKTGRAADVEALYHGKIEQRQAELEADGRYAETRDLLQRHRPEWLPAALTERFKRLWTQIGYDGSGAADCAQSHGDLCFSNILYDRQSGLMKFIDPRGATTPDEVYLDGLYDLAKLSHSVLGLYDFINHDLFELRFDRDLGLSVDLAAPPLASKQGVFRAFLADAGFDSRKVRLAEASLFLSMLPLHLDVPKKVVGFLSRAAAILDELESGNHSY